MYCVLALQAGFYLSMNSSTVILYPGLFCAVFVRGFQLSQVELHQRTSRCLDDNLEDMDKRFPKNVQVVRKWCWHINRGSVFSESELN